MIQKAQRTGDVPVANQRREGTTGTARGLHDEVQRNPDGQEAAFGIAQDREKKQNVFDSESRSDLSVTVQKDTEVIHREVEGGTGINCYLKENQSQFSETLRMHTRRGAALHVVRH